MIVIIDYGCGNVRSVSNAFKVLNCDVRISSQANDVRNASHLVLPGVGAFKECTKGLAGSDILEPLHREVIEKGKPLLGICVGLQVLATIGLEFGQHEGLGWIPGSVGRIDTSASKLRLPHMGWNEISIKMPEPLFRGLSGSPAFYFVHSYHLIPEDKSNISSTCDYGVQVISSVQKNNIFGVQFHPEKSQSAGIGLLKNFISLG